MAATVAKSPEHRKSLGAYYTPFDVAETLVKWVVRSPQDRLLDPSCGDGRFLAAHSRAVGVDCDPAAVGAVAERARHATVIVDDFFTWANDTRVRFDCAAGNPPFIRYQRFNGDRRAAALTMCRRLGVQFSGLTSSWAPFLVAAGSLLKPGGRMAFVVPAELGHAPYASPLVNYLLDHFADVRVIAVRDKVFPELSEDVWFVYADGYGGRSEQVAVISWDTFRPSDQPPASQATVSRAAWQDWNQRLRPFVLPRDVLDAYRELTAAPGVSRLGDVAKVGIGYVTGANDFFHLRPSTARTLAIPDRLLVPSVRRASYLSDDAVSPRTVQRWIQADEPVLLLRLAADEQPHGSVKAYLESDDGEQARQSYKCRMRSPWYSVPDVHVPDAFLTYMSSRTPKLVANRAACVCTNSVHAVQLKPGLSTTELLRRWSHPLVALSCELEGHALGGGLLKLEPKEAARVALPPANMPLSRGARSAIERGLTILRSWRHHA